jgi:hypothetical protein
VGISVCVGVCDGVTVAEVVMVGVDVAVLVTVADCKGIEVLVGSMVE